MATQEEYRGFTVAQLIREGLSPGRADVVADKAIAIADRVMRVMNEIPEDQTLSTSESNSALAVAAHIVAFRSAGYLDALGVVEVPLRAEGTIQ